MPQSYSPVYLPQDWSATSMGANNLIADACDSNKNAEVILTACLDPDNAINQGNAASYSHNNLVASGNTGHVTLKTNILTDGSSKYVWEVTVIKHDPNIKIGAILPGDVVSGGEQIGTNSSTGQGWAFVSDNGEAIYHDNDTAAMSSNTAIVDGDMYHLEFNNDTGDVYVWRKASGGTWTAENSGNSVTSGSGKTALADKKVHLAGHLYQTVGTNLMRFNFSGPFDKPASATYVPLTQTVTGVGNYATFNSIYNVSGFVSADLSNGNLTANSTNTGSANARHAVATIPIPSSGKWAAKMTYNYGTWLAFGVGQHGTYPGTPSGPYQDSTFDGLYQDASDLDIYDSGSAASTGHTKLSAGGYAEILVDVDANTIKVYTNGSQTGSTITNISATTPVFVVFLEWSNVTLDFGQKGYIPTDTSYKTLHTANLPAPTVKNPDDGFSFITLEDGATIEASLATARTGWSNFIDVFFRETDGQDKEVRFSDDSGNSMHFNTNAAAGSEQTLSSGVNYSAWSWRVGAAYGCYTAEISHDNSSPTTQAHGLGSGAKSAVAKRSDSTGDWYISHPNLSSANCRFNVQEVSTSELVTVDGTNITLSTSFPSGTYRVIVWEQIEGFSAFTGYDHNGSTTDGPYVHLNGSASLVLWRNIDSSNSNDFFSTFPTYTSNGNGNPTDVRYNWGNQEKGYTGITIGDVTANGYKMRPSAGGAFGKDADDPMLVWAWGLRPFGGSGVAQARAR